MKNLISSYNRLACIVYSGEVKDEVATKSRMRCVGGVMWEYMGSGFSFINLMMANEKCRNM